MKILLTGTTGYIGKRLLPYLLNNGHDVICCVRDKSRMDTSSYYSGKLTVIEVDFLKPNTLDQIPIEIDIAYYLIHSMSTSTENFEKLESDSAQNFVVSLKNTNIKQVIYLSGIVNDETLSRHLTSRLEVEKILSQGNFKLTTLRAGIIVGSGSASFEIIRDLVEKLPFMITPKWLNTRSQPISIRNILEFLIGVIDKKETLGQSFDIGGPEILTYKEMLNTFAKVRKLKRLIITLPVMTPKLSSYWLFFVTSTSYKLAVNLVNSMKVEIICRPNNLAKMLDIKLISYEDAVIQALTRINQKNVQSSWTDAQSSSKLSIGIDHLVDVPKYGCFTDIKLRTAENPDLALERIWSIGGENGWYYANWLWSIRGFWINFLEE